MSEPLSLDPEKWDVGCRRDPVRNEFVIPTVRAYIHERRVKRAIDVGCGTGYLPRMLAMDPLTERVQWTLLDRNAAMLAYASRYFPNGADVQYITANAEAYSGERHAWVHDLGICAYTMLEVDDLELFAHALWLLVPSGTLLVFLPDAVPDIVRHYLSEKTSPDVSNLYDVTHQLRKIDGFTGRAQTFLARQAVDFVEALVSDDTVLEKVISYRSPQGSRHFCLVFTQRWAQA